MKKIGFIGGYEKTDLILYVARLLVEVGKSVLVVDTTINQRAKYIVPTITPSIYYITEYEKIDVACGFENIEGICEYLNIDELAYDLVLIDIDSEDAFMKFGMYQAEKNFFVTAFDKYSLKKGLEIIGEAQNKIEMTKILFSKNMQVEENEYLDFLASFYKVEWANDKIYFPYDSGANKAIINNQRACQIRFKELDPIYKDGILSVVYEIDSSIKSGDVKKAVKRIL